MKKVIALLMVAFTSISLNAAITEWSCYLSDTSSDIHSGMGYLIEIANGTKDTNGNAFTSASLSDYLSTTGLTGTIEGVKSVANGTFSGPLLNKAESSLTENLTSTYCILIVKDGKFAITTDVALTDENVWKSQTNSASGVTSYSGAYFFAEGAVTEFGTGGSVPEPTVLALLALGVAGVALRRKKVVA